MAKARKRKEWTQDISKRKKRRGSSSGGQRKDEFFQQNGDEELASDHEEGSERGDDEVQDDEEEEQRAKEREETAEEKKLRLASVYLDKVRQAVAAAAEDGGDEADREKSNAGNRDSLVADLLKQQQLEESGRVQRKIAARVVEPSETGEGRYVGRRHRRTVTAVALTEDDSRGFSASKDGLIVHWDVESGKSEKYEWPSGEASTSGKNSGAQSHGNQGRKKGSSRHVLTIAVSSDGRYLASGGLDRTVHVWDTRTREHIQAFPGHKGAVSSLAFRLGTQQLISGAFDRTIKLWSVDDRAYIDTLYGHQSEVVSIDCLLQERVFSAGRDRTLRLWKVPEETQLVFRGHGPSMESCCFLSNGEFLSGSDDGSIALWSALRKKPAFIVRNAHGSAGPADHSSAELDGSEKPLIAASSKAMANGSANGQTYASDGEPLHSQTPPAPQGAAAQWVGAVAVCRGSDLVASGAGDGIVQLWALEDGNKSIRRLHGLPVKGFVNSLKFAHSGRFLLAGVGQEPRLGRWGYIQGLRNGVVMHDINLS